MILCDSGGLWGLFFFGVSIGIVLTALIGGAWQDRAEYLREKRLQDDDAG